MLSACSVNRYTVYAERIKNICRKKFSFSTCLTNLKGQYFEKNLMGDYTVYWPRMNKVQVVFFGSFFKKKLSASGRLS
jgi:hypothetical protein